MILNEKEWVKVMILAFKTGLFWITHVQNTLGVEEVQDMGRNPLDIPIHGGGHHVFCPRWGVTTPTRQWAKLSLYSWTWRMP